ncbi:transposase InsO family protein [Sinorhizobium meliloti]
MKASQVSDAQKAFILKQGHEGVPVAEICRKAGDQPGDVFQLEEKVCRHVAAGDEEAEAARGRECAAEEDRCGPDVGPRNAAGCYSPKALRPARKREVVKGMCRDWAISIRRACGALNFDRSTYHYTSRRADQAGLERRIREICETRVRYGYRRVHVLLEREGWGTNIKRTYRIYRDLGLQLRNKTPKRRVKAKLREDRQTAIGPNDVWAMDFVHDQLATGKKLRVLTVVDTFSRYVPVLDPRHSYRGEDVVQTLERVCRQVGYRRTIRVDQGTEFVSRDLDLWAYAKGVTLDFSRPGSPRTTPSSKRSTAASGRNA